ncbi:Pesticin receptor [Zhongshania aliphaticivorans]|uniref:Pesticin receptor n=1 Tax=Zhongshania aliphaticivorans TaxID=1470434 RepID=A0A5S9N278_9GAMM|nr:TonB-dependent receptor [Zhongshania aliphaticivorans]CAA0082741.1 Pesticin receptor [Zhongshania aliphaticivorans]CAA0083977.1 Pesticin receptor [Zhongshania aliphaticivorans]
MINITSNKKRLAMLVAIGSASALNHNTAWSQQDISVVLEEVLVTAQKREQNLQEVPVSITSFNATELETKGITTITELEKSVPNTQFRASRATNSTLTAYIRGVGQQDPLWGFEPGVGVYVDDVYYARPQAAVMDVFDVERIEVLRGPQGTLYGKNTVGGAIKYITRKMTGDAEAKITAATGAYGQRDVSISGQLPVIDNELYLGGAIAKMTRDGYGDVDTGYDINTGTYSSSEENYNKDVLVARVSAEYTPNDQLFIRLSGDRTDDNSNQPCGSQSNQSLLTHPSTGQAFTTSSSPYDGACGTSHVSNVENSGFSLTAQYDLSETTTVKYVFAKREGETQQFIDFDGTPLDAFDVPAKYSDDQKSHELQFNYTVDRLAIVAGLYYFTGNSAGAFDVVLNGLGGTPYMDGEHYDLAIGGDVDTESTSAYINASIDLTANLTLTTGLRLTKDDKNSNIQRYAYNTTNSFPYTQNQGSGFTYGDPNDDTLLSIATDISDKEADKDWSELSPSIKLDWQMNDNVMLYVSYAEGFKSGGFDMRGNASTNPDVAKGYDPETVDTIEAGIKSQLWDDRLRLNFTVFDMDYTDMQLTVQTAQPAPVFFSSDVVNAGTAEIQGAELEALLQVTSGISTSVAIGHMNAELTEVISAGVDVSDSWEMLNAPDWTGQLGVNFERDLGNAGSIMVNTAASYRDASRNFNNVLCSCDQDKAYTLLDASANWYSADEHWTVSVYLKNITDKEYKTGGYNLGSGELAFYGAPRTWTASVAYAF